MRQKNYAEHSAGAVVYWRSQERYLFLIIQHRGGHWGFPKGHLERSEDSREAARREIREETQIEIHFVPDFYFTSEYRTKYGAKLVEYFLAEALNPEDLDFQDEELDAALWLPYEAARARLTYDVDREILGEVARGLDIESAV